MTPNTRTGWPGRPCSTHDHDGFTTPSHPSYPSAHSCLSAAAATVLAREFPSDAAALNALTDPVG